MAKKIIFYVIVFFTLKHSDNLKAWDTTAANFYPLSVGNVYVFNYNDLYINCTYRIYLNSYRVTITDFVRKSNGKWYYKFSGWNPIVHQNPVSWLYQRIDSNSMNVYSYDSVTNTETLLDSLKGTYQSQFNCHRFTDMNGSGLIVDTVTHNVLGEPRLIKLLNCTNYFPSSLYYELVEGIGFYQYEVCEAGGGGEYVIKGCVINGIRYGDTTLTEIQQVSATVPDNFYLSQNYPNPFNPVTNLEFGISKSEFVSLKVYDALGKEVAVLVNERKNPGSYSAKFDGSRFSSCVYYYSLIVDGGVVNTKRMILLR